MKIFFITCAALIVCYTIYKTYRIMNLDNGLQKKIANGAVILDVRTKFEFERGHIPGSVNIPLSALHSGPVPFPKDQVMITCCSHGLRSVKAVSLLKGHGYKNVFNGGAISDLEECIKKK